MKPRRPLTVLRVSNTILAFPNSEWQKICMTAMDFEKKLYLQSPDKVRTSPFPCELGAIRFDTDIAIVRARHGS
jgi:hypothetical protein